MGGLLQFGNVKHGSAMKPQISKMNLLKIDLTGEMVFF